MRIGNEKIGLRGRKGESNEEGNDGWTKTNKDWA
jgi:hypothetical protein